MQLHGEGNTWLCSIHSSCRAVCSISLSTAALCLSAGGSILARTGSQGSGAEHKVHVMRHIGGVQLSIMVQRFGTSCLCFTLKHLSAVFPVFCCYWEVYDF